MNLPRPRSLGRQIAYRLTLALTISSLLAGAVGLWFFHALDVHNRAVDAERAHHHYVEQVAILEQRWGREAYNFRTRLEFSKLLQDPRQRQARVQAYMSAQGGATDFPMFRITSSDGTSLANYAPANQAIPEGIIDPGAESGWLFEPKQKRLYYVLRQNIWTGESNAELLVFRPIDHALLTQKAYPDTRLSIWWDGQPIVTSIGTDGIESALNAYRQLPPEIAQDRMIRWSTGPEESPQLFIEMLGRHSLPIAQLILPMVFGVLCFAIAAWIILGAWLVNTLRRLRSLEQAQLLFLSQRELTPDIKASLETGRARERDEIAGLATSLNYLMRNTVEHDRSQKNIMHTLGEHHQTLKAILETTRDGFWIVGINGRIVDVNPGYLAMSGYSHDDLLDMRVHDLEATESPQAVDEHIARVLVSRHEIFETMHRRKDGSTWEVEVSVGFSPTAGGRFFVFLRDISERRQQEADLRIAATTFEAQEGIMITDARGLILRVNRTFCEITGYEASEVIGRSPALLNSGRHDADFYRTMWDELARDGVWQGEIWNRRKNGEVYIEQLTITAVRDGNGHTTNFVGTFADITQSKRAADEIRNLAFYDPLTGLPNRRLLLDRLQQATTTSARHHKHGALMLFDLDDFKTLNDTLGHDVGDQFLIQVAQRLTTSVRQGDTVARLGGDEFVVILEDLDGGPMAALQAEAVATKIQQALSQGYELAVREEGQALQTRQHRCTSSLGITLFQGNELSTDELMKRADTAMYQAKAAGRDTLRFFDPDMQASLATRAALTSDLRTALDERQFSLHYQPQIDDSGQVIGAEALLRWEHPERGLIPPVEFIPLAEETGLILGLGDWVMETACTQLAAWATHPRLAPLTLAVNVSARQFADPRFVDNVESLLARTGADPKRLKLELTESMLVSDVASIIDIMTALKNHGIRFSLDDFGTGYSSLSYIKTLPLDQLKIDRSFVRDVLDDDDDAAIATAIISMAQNLKLNVIAEGVETLSQRNFLASAGCLSYQGYYFSRPLPLAAFESYVLQHPVQ